MRKKNVIIAFIVLALIPLEWILILPYVRIIPADFHYEATIFSLDNFYNEKERHFYGEILSKAKFYYNVIDKKGNVLIVKIIFDVRKPTGEQIFLVERIYGIDRNTGQHITGYGDRDRTGYLFAPRHANKQDFVYWHVNYDTPAFMKFQEEEIIGGLTTYRYQSIYKVDQTTNLYHLPGVPEKMGVEQDVILTTWVDPETGFLIKYEDYTTSWYYDIHTKKRIVPWNKFHNEYSYSSVLKKVEMVKQIRFKVRFLKIYLPVLILFVSFIILIFGYAKK